MGNVDLNQKLDFITKGLSASAMFSFKNWSSTETSRSSAYNQFEVGNYTWNADKSAIDNYVLRRVGKLEETVLKTNTDKSSTGNRQIYIQAMLNYERTISEIHGISAMLNYNQEEGSINNPTSLIESLPQRKQGLAGRITYSYDYKYMIEANFGYNGSENFAAGKRFGFFPSVGVGYLISEEKFFEPLRNTISSLKLRGSWGLVGNDSANDRYVYLSDIELQNGDFKYTTGREQDISQSGPKYLRYANPNITWEVGDKLNLGLDLNIKNQLYFAIDVFREKRRDIFLERQSIPQYIGMNPTDKWMKLETKMYGNLGVVHNKGLDFSIDYHKTFSKDLHMTFKGTFTYASNEIKAYDEPAYQKYPNLSRVGHSVDRKLLYIADRLFIDNAEVANSNKQNIGGFISAGDIKYVNLPDANGDYDNVIDQNDQMYTGYPTTPEVIYGFGPSIRYKQFDFSFFFQGAARTSILMSGIHPFGTDGTRSVLQYIADDYWSENSNPNIHAKYPRLSKNDNANNTAESTYWMRNGAFLKLKNAELGFNHKLFRVYLRGSNLLTFSGFKHWDPEQGGGNGLKYPTQRVFNLGIQFGFNK